LKREEARKLETTTAIWWWGSAKGNRRCGFILMSNRVCWYGWCDLERVPWDGCRRKSTTRNYGEAGGVKIPFRWTLARPGGRFTIQVSDVKQNVPVDDAKFAKPPAPPEGQKGPAK